VVTPEPACAYRRKAFGKPDAGNPHVRFDEGGGVSLTLLLYSTGSVRRTSSMIPERIVELLGGKLSRASRSLPLPGLQVNPQLMVQIRDSVSQSLAENTGRRMRLNVGQVAAKFFAGGLRTVDHEMHPGPCFAVFRLTHSGDRSNFLQSFDFWEFSEAGIPLQFSKMLVVVNTHSWRDFKVLGQAFVQPQRHHGQRAVQQRVSAFMTHVRLELIVLVGKDHAGATLLDEQGPPVGHVGEVCLDVVLVGTSPTKQEKMDRFLRRLDPQRPGEIFLQSRHFVDQ